MCPSIHCLTLPYPHGLPSFSHKWVPRHNPLNRQKFEVPMRFMSREPKVLPNRFGSITVAGLSSSAQVLSTPSPASTTSFTNVGWLNCGAASSGLDTGDLVDDVVVRTRDGVGDGIGVACEAAGVSGCIVRVKAECTICTLTTLLKPRLFRSQIPTRSGNLCSHMDISQL